MQRCKRSAWTFYHKEWRSLHALLRQEKVQQKCELNPHTLCAWLGVFWQTRDVWLAYCLCLLFSLTVVSDSFVIPWTTASQASLSFTVSWRLLQIMSIESVILYNHLIFCCPLLLPSIFPASESFPMSRHFASDSQNIGASASVLPMNIQDWFPLGLTGLISFQCKGLSRVFSNTTVQKHQFFSTQLSLWSNSHIHTWLMENHSFDYTDLCQQSDLSANFLEWLMRNHSWYWN